MTGRHRRAPCTKPRQPPGLFVAGPRGQPRPPGASAAPPLHCSLVRTTEKCE